MQHDKATVEIYVCQTTRTFIQRLFIAEENILWDETIVLLLGKCAPVVAN